MSVGDADRFSCVGRGAGTAARARGWPATMALCESTRRALRSLAFAS